MEAKDIARTAVEVASDKQASDILMLDLRGHASFTDYFVICSADSTRQISSITNDLERTLRDHGIRAHHREGTDSSGWVLVDFGDVIVHIFSPETRAYYDLEGAWSAAPQVVRIQ
ncbi:MAG: ribosome silencing factor [Chloroflexi bacterium]|nr:ribosome silencing factor [Chloroflexota bacterium]